MKRPATPPKRATTAQTAKPRRHATPELRELAEQPVHLPMMHELYRRAEAEVRKQRKGRRPKAETPNSEADPQRLLHELQVHQVELEMQNEELRKTRDEMEAGRDKYSDLYDFAPVGYLTLDREGTIAEANLAAASLLGVARGALAKRRFGAFVSTADRSVFAAFLQQVFKDKAREECDLRLLSKGTKSVDVRLRAIVSSTGQECRVAVTDITERKQAEIKVQESEERFRVMANAMPQLAWIGRPDGHIFWYNQRWYDYTGTTSKQMEGWGWQSVHDTDELPKVLKSWKASLETGEPFEMTFPLRGADGVFRPFLTRVIPLRNATGRVAQWFGTNTDVTEQKLAEDKVRVSEVRYRRLFETAHDAVLILDPATRKITDSNPFMTQMLGYSHDQLVGKELFEIGLLKDEAASKQMFHKLKQDREVRYEDLPLKSKAGSHQQVEVVANLYQENGHAVIQCNIRDITARKTAEHDLSEKARLLDLTHDAIIVRDMEGHIRYWNDGAKELYGWSRKEAMGKVSNVLLKTEYPIPLEEMTEELFRTDRWIGELVHTNRAGRRITVFARKTLDRDTRGKPAAVLENITDISERKKAEEALRRNEALFSSLIEQAPVGVYVVDARFRMQQVNRTAQPAFKKIHPLLGRDFSEVVHLVWPKRVADQIEKLFRHTLKTGEPYQSPEFTARRQDIGVKEIYEWQIQRVTLPAGEHGVVCFFNNITERKRAEETQRRVEVLAASNRKLHGEIMRRQAVEESLRKSEQHQTRLLEQSRQMQEQLRQLSRLILTAQEEERREISRELHDVIAQTLTAINVRLAALKKQAATTTAGLDRNIVNTQRLVEKSVEIVHQFARELRPTVLDDLGLIPALHAFLKGFTTRTGVRTHLTVFADIEKIDPDKRTMLYRVAQEALTNVARHAKATNVAVRLQKLPSGVRMTVKDDGRSFDVSRLMAASGSARLGLLGMRERVEMVGGVFSIESAPGHGTAVHVEIPGKTIRTTAPKKTGRSKMPSP